jgi:hypothetical protein
LHFFRVFFRAWLTSGSAPLFSPHASGQLEVAVRVCLYVQRSWLLSVHTRAF